MRSDFNNRLIKTARERLSPEIQYQFDRLSLDAQTDIAVTLMYCADQLPPVFQPEHLSNLVATVEERLHSLASQPDVVR